MGHGTTYLDPRQLDTYLARGDVMNRIAKHNYDEKSTYIGTRRVGTAFRNENTCRGNEIKLGFILAVVSYFC